MGWLSNLIERVSRLEIAYKMSPEQTVRFLQGKAGGEGGGNVIYAKTVRVVDTQEIREGFGKEGILIGAGSNPKGEITVRFFKRGKPGSILLANVDSRIFLTRKGELVVQNPPGSDEVVEQIERRLVFPKKQR